MALSEYEQRVLDEIELDLAGMHVSMFQRCRDAELRCRGRRVRMAPALVLIAGTVTIALLACFAPLIATVVVSAAFGLALGLAFGRRVVRRASGRGRRTARWTSRFRNAIHRRRDRPRGTSG